MESFFQVLFSQFDDMMMTRFHSGLSMFYSPFIYYVIFH